MSRDDQKRRAAIAAAGEVRSGMLVGLGTGSTAAFLIEELGRQVADGLRIEATATSKASEALAERAGLRVRPFDTVARVDLAIDGVDEIDSSLRAIKGAGGAMLREKVVAEAATRMVAIADASKRVERLGAAAVPVEVLPFAQAFVEARLRDLGAKPVLRRMGDDIYVTDQGNAVMDCRFADMATPDVLAGSLARIPGLLGHGLFLREIDAAYIGLDDAVDHVERPMPAA